VCAGTLIELRQRRDKEDSKVECLTEEKKKQGGGFVESHMTILSCGVRKVAAHYPIMWCQKGQVILLSCRVILLSCRVILLSSRVILLSSRVILLSCRVILLSCRVILLSCRPCMVILFSCRIILSHVGSSSLM